MRDLRIVFMGTPDFAVAILKRLVEDNYTIVGVVTAPDKPAGRGRKITESAVKKYAIEQNLFLLQPTNLKSEDFINKLKEVKSTLQVIVAFRMLPKIVWEIPIYGTFNLHASLLPSYRGAAPIHWAIINGEEKTGVTTFFIDEKIDTGEIILQKEILIHKDEIVGELHDRLMVLGATLVSETVVNIRDDKISTQKQPKIDEKIAPKLFPENCKINWEDSLDSIYNHIRGLNPFPAAWSEMNNNDGITTVKIYKVRKEKVAHTEIIKTITTSKKEIKIAVKGGYIYIDELKVSGKKKLDSKSLLNGYSFSSNAEML
ncbi:MAG: methionyl-tRNA formyltransferase [Flavobacteriaceae bacterium]|nr:methionyl-tRNA formyltransferase [Flavobacteriaceae bacterium]MDG2276052.1 methionyl-tRNA formyltransferase [Flavobacteriaceae bacterium]